MIQAKRAYEILVEEALIRGVHELPIGLMIREFEARWGFLTETADKRIRRLAEVKNHEISHGMLKF